MYTYQVLEEELIVRIFYDDALIDQIGPWDSLESAATWAESYVNKMNAGVPEPDIA